MKKLIIISALILVTILAVMNVASAAWYNPFSWGNTFGASVLTAPQGGTGIGTATAGDVGKAVVVADDSPFTYTLQTVSGIGGGSGGTFSTTTSTVAGQLINYPNNATDIVTVGSNATTSAEFWFDPNVPRWFTSGVGTLSGGFLSQASSTQMGDFFLPSLSQGYLYTGSNGITRTVASSSAVVGSATSLVANGGNCSAGNAPLGVDQLGAVESCFDVWTEAENTSAAYISDGNTNWDNSYGFTTFAYPFPSAATTTRLTFSGGLDFTYSSSTIYSSFLTSSSTFANIGTLTFGGVTGSAWSTFCNSITGSASLCDGDDATSAGGSALIATSTNETAGHLAYWSTTSGTPARLNSVATSSVTCSGGVTCTGLVALGSSPTISSFTYPFPSAATTTRLSLNGGVNFNYSSSTIYSSFITSSSTFGYFGTLTVPALTSALTLTGAGGEFAEYTGTSCTNQFVRSLSVLGAATCATVANTDLANSTISGVALGSNLNALTNDATLNGSSYNGSAAISDWGLNLANANTWTAKQDFFGSASSTLFSANWLKVGGTASTTIDTDGSVKIATTTPWLRSILNVVGTTTIKGQFATIAASTTANATQSIDWSTGNTQKIMLTAATNIVVNSTSSNPIDGGKYTLKICQDPVGSRTLTWANPTSLRWWNGTTTITATANKCTWIGMIYTEENGNNIYSVVASSTNVDIR